MIRGANHSGEWRNLLLIFRMFHPSKSGGLGSFGAQRGLPGKGQPASNASQVFDPESRPVPVPRVFKNAWVLVVNEG